MITLTEPLKDPITMKIELDLSQPRILDYLTQKGYKVEAYHLVLDAEEEILISEPKMSEWTFTATKDGENPSENSLYLKVFEKEIKTLLNAI